MSNDFVKQQYNKLAENYSAGRDVYKNDKYLEKLNSLLASNSTILDIGCGAGVPVDKYFLDRGHKIIGIDISEKQIELVTKNLPTGEFKVEDMSELKEREYSVNAVISFYAIFHTPRETHGEILKKVSSFLKTNGLLLITMGSSEWEGKEDNFFGGEMSWSHYGKEKNRQLVEETGFKILLDEIDDSGGEKHQMILAKKI
ncbi:MAG TPA: class I SAM-dependent methyltransferase [Patescibacteria group bacterium]|nr:class I SAM-dependent methyltransferase [Patescibacteria group bacterium]